jgi:hypothetical protein
VGHGDTTTIFHQDGQDAWLCQIQGKKRVTLFSPLDRKFVYPLNPYDRSVINEYRDIMMRERNWVQVYATNLKEVPLSSETVLPVKENVYPPSKMKNLSDTYQKLVVVFKETIDAYNKFLSSKKAMNIVCNINEIYVGEVFERYFNMILCLEKGSVKIRDYEYVLEPGQIIIFPNEPGFFNIEFYSKFKFAALK